MSSGRTNQSASRQDRRTLIKAWLGAGLGLVCVRPARAAVGLEPLRVVTTLPVLAEVTRAIGGPLVEVEALADPRQNPHFVDPRPTLVQRSRKAQLFVEVGLELEPWARRVAMSSGNSAIQPGQPGHLVSSRGITSMEVPVEATRQEGNIHPYGNPYVWLDPLNLEQMARNIAAALVRLDPANGPAYEAGLEAFAGRLAQALFGEQLVDEIGAGKLARLSRQGRLEAYLTEREIADRLGGWLAKARPLAGRRVVSHHKTWIYFATRFGLTVPIEIEEKPGIQPSARHRERVRETIEQLGIKTILIERYQDRRTADWLAKRTGAKVRAVPIDVGKAVEVRDYFDLIDQLLDGLLSSEGR